MEQPAVDLRQQPDGNREQQAAVDERGENFRAVPAEGALLGSRTRRQQNGSQAEHERHQVGEHVGRVAEEGQAVGPQPAGHLSDQHDRGEKDREEKVAARGRGTRAK